MKRVSSVSLGLVLTVASLFSFASTEVSTMDSRSVYGHISATGESNLDSLTAALNKKANAAGASGFYITSAGGKNKLHGSAVLLK